MHKKEVLLLLQDLIRNAVISHTDSEDMSGWNTKYMVDQEQLLINIQKELDTIEGETVNESMSQTEL